MFKTFAAVIGMVLGGLVMLVAISLLLSIPTWLLWNWLMPTIFGLNTITIFQAWGLMFLSNILFKTSVTTKKED